MKKLREYMPFTNGVPSLATFSRVLSNVDEELVSLAVINWVGEIINTRGCHISIDGKGLRAAAEKMCDRKTPYIVNAIDVATKLVIGQLAIPEKENEMTAIPDLIERLELENSVVTIDAIGATERIMSAIHDAGADFVLQVKGNCPELFDELKLLFNGLSEEKKKSAVDFGKKYGDKYSEVKTQEKNRERYEYRHYQVYSDPDGLGGIQELQPYINCIGLSKQVRVLGVHDKDGNDITPGLREFLENGSRKQPKPAEGGRLKDDIQTAGLIASRVINAEEMMKYKREHWAVENSLHYILDETFGEDKSTIRKGKDTASMLRKAAYNIVRLIQLTVPQSSPLVPDIIDEISADLDMGAKMILEPIPSFY